MTHTFLLDAGRWTLEGNWLERNDLRSPAIQQPPVPVSGKTLIAWSQDNWFTMITKLAFPNQQRPELVLQYRGRLGLEEQRYTFVLQHSQLGRAEGEGWIAPDSIVQQFWALEDRDRRSGFETIRRLSHNCYSLSYGVMDGHYLINVLEATLERQRD